MVDLSKRSGLPIGWDKKSMRLVRGEGVVHENREPDIRRRADMQEVLFDSRAEELDELYYMYRGLAFSDDVPLIRQFGLRYDITVLRPGTISREFVKTAGHYHPKKPGTDLTWPEVYEVLNGRAHYLMQCHFPGRPDKLEAVYLIAAKPGDKVLVPPGYGHITINPGDDFLIMSNWVADGFASIYEPIKKMRGGAYFELRGEEAPEFVANSSYTRLPSLKRCPVIPMEEFSLIRGLPFYSVFKEDNHAFKFLTHPEEYRDTFGQYLQQLSKEE